MYTPRLFQIFCKKSICPSPDVIAVLTMPIFSGKMRNQSQQLSCYKLFSYKYDSNGTTGSNRFNY